MFNDTAHKEKMKWFMNDRLGMFIHWGLYAIPARGEWVRSVERISKADYQQYFDSFNPVDFDARKWARDAKAAGMKYAVLTAKHHDGFCLFDSKHTEYKVTNTPFGRDIIAEFCQALREEGLKVGLYYSLLDWHHDDYPHYKDRIHPMRDDESYKDKKINFDNYITYMHNQVRELCTNYGKIDIMWFDFSYDDLEGEKWQATKLVTMLNELQPGLIMDNRLDSGQRSIITNKPEMYCGDFESPEQLIPPGGMVNNMGEPIPWEACITMNNNWGYHRYDKDFKSAKTILRKLVECVSKGGNMLLNVGPDARGNFPDESLKILSDMGEWMRKNSESIYGCGRSAFEKPENGRITQKGKTVYFHVMEDVIGPIHVKVGSTENIKSARFLKTGAELEVEGTTQFAGDSFAGYTFMHYGEIPHGTYPLLDDIDTVIEITLK